MKYQIEIADDASAEAEDAYLWMMEQLSKERAEKWFDGLMDAIDTLSNLLPPDDARITIARRRQKCVTSA